MRLSADREVIGRAACLFRQRASFLFPSHLASCPIDISEQPPNQRIEDTSAQARPRFLVEAGGRGDRDTSVSPQPACVCHPKDDVPSWASIPSLLPRLHAFGPFPFAGSCRGACACSNSVPADHGSRQPAEPTAISTQLILWGSVRGLLSTMCEAGQATSSSRDPDNDGVRERRSTTCHPPVLERQSPEWGRARLPLAMAGSLDG
jgi:hypothetical protein